MGAIEERILMRVPTGSEGLGLEEANRLRRKLENGPNPNGRVKTTPNNAPNKTLKPISFLLVISNVASSSAAIAFIPMNAIDPTPPRAAAHTRKATKLVIV